MQYSDEELTKLSPKFTNHYADTNGPKPHYVISGQGEPLILNSGLSRNLVGLASKCTPLPSLKLLHATLTTDRTTIELTDAL